MNKGACENDREISAIDYTYGMSSTSQRLANNTYIMRCSLFGSTCSNGQINSSAIVELSLIAFNDACFIAKDSPESCMSGMIKPTHFIPCRGEVEIGQHRVPRRGTASSTVMHPKIVEIRTSALSAQWYLYRIRFYKVVATFPSARLPQASPDPLSSSCFLHWLETELRMARTEYSTIMLFVLTPTRALRLLDPSK